MEGSFAVNLVGAVDRAYTLSCASPSTTPRIHVSLVFVCSILAVKKAGQLNIKTMFDFDARVLIGWLTNSLRELANQNACFKVNDFCFHVNVASLSYGEYSCIMAPLLSRGASNVTNKRQESVERKMTQVAQKRCLYNSVCVCVDRFRSPIFLQ